MCNLTQPVVSTLVSTASYESLAQLFMKNIVLSFEIVAVIVMDASSKFSNIFEAMCEILKVYFWPLSRGNHKGNSVEQYHEFLNKTQAIVGQARGTYSTFCQNIMTS